MTNNSPRYTAIKSGINSATPSIFMGSYVASGTTSQNTLQPVTTVPGALADAQTQVTSGSVRSASGVASGGDMSAAPTLGITAWTVSSAIYIDFDA